MELDLTGKRALVCGSTQGIGWATALELSKLGAEVILMARDTSKLKKRASELSAARGQKHGYVVADFHHPKTVAEAVDALVSEKPVQILINNTGGPPPGPAHLADVADFRSAFEWHLVNNQRLLQSCLPGMKEAGYGRVVNVISTSVHSPQRIGCVQYHPGAVASWAKTVSNEVAGFGITVNNVLPGATETERLHQIIANKAQKQLRKGMRWPTPCAGDPGWTIRPTRRTGGCYCLSLLASCRLRQWGQHSGGWWPNRHHLIRANSGR